MLSVILAGGTVPPELASDFGSICSAALPIAGQPVILRQIERFDESDVSVVVSLPSDDRVIRFMVADKQSHVRVEETRGEEEFSEVLNRALKERALENRENESLVIVFGDSLAEVPDPDAMAVQSRPDARRYTTVFRDDSAHLCFESRGALKRHDVSVVGAFHFSSRHDFARILDCHVGSGSTDPFYAALSEYDSNTQKIALHPVEEWLDLGHLDTYYEARRLAFSARHFNDVTYRDGGTVIKRSSDGEKINREITWYRSLPRHLALNTPRLVDYEDGPKPWYEIEYIAHPTVADLLLWGQLGQDDWKGIFRCIDEMLQTMWSHGEGHISEKVIAAARRAMYVDKTVDRLTALRETAVWQALKDDFQLNGRSCLGLRSVAAVLQDLWARQMENLPPTWGVIHGDLFPGNMLYDRRQQRITVLDPRGSFGMPGPQGDFLYDLAKLSHSFNGEYDGILAGLVSLVTVEPGRFRWNACEYIPDWLAQEHTSRQEAWSNQLSCQPSLVKLIESLLFLGMLPLHADRLQRQFALAARGLELFTSWMSSNEG